MIELRGTRDPFTQISKRLKRKYNSRDLCHYWSNYLDPEHKLTKNLC